MRVYQELAFPDHAFSDDEKASWKEVEDLASFTRLHVKACRDCNSRILLDDYFGALAVRTRTVKDVLRRRLKGVKWQIDYYKKEEGRLRPEDVEAQSHLRRRLAWKPSKANCPQDVTVEDFMKEVIKAGQATHKTRQKKGQGPTKRSWRPVAVVEAEKEAQRQRRAKN
jgi:hypothetical protein